MDKNLQNWMDKYYPIPASQLAKASDIDCVQHSLNKWEGARDAEQYDLTYRQRGVVSKDKRFQFNFSCGSCSLCQKYYRYDCSNEKGISCPIVRYQGKRCDGYSESAYDLSYNDPTPMIELLQQTLEFVKKESI